ncbi:hypothetical protein [Salinibacterium sp. GXW1014]|uniref:hypothetical protein n=1 Tax=Salinibacterium sp. GXW1014 TaxID=3377838 RepID=UPI00383A810C
MTVDENTAPNRSTARVSVAAVWLFVAVGAVITAVFVAPDARLQWFPIVLAAATILSFCLQLALDSKVGFVNRLMASVGGSVVILAVATGVLALATSVEG